MTGTRGSRTTTLQFLNRCSHSGQMERESSLICSSASMLEPFPKQKANGMVKKRNCASALPPATRCITPGPGSVLAEPLPTSGCPMVFTAPCFPQTATLPQPIPVSQGQRGISAPAAAKQRRTSPGTPAASSPSCAPPPLAAPPGAPSWVSSSVSWASHTQRAKAGAEGSRLPQGQRHMKLPGAQEMRSSLGSAVTPWTCRTHLPQLQLAGQAQLHGGCRPRAALWPQKGTVRMLLFSWCRSLHHLALSLQTRQGSKPCLLRLNGPGRN